MRDIALFAALVGLFAALVTTHVAIVAGLARRTPRWRAAAALLVPVLAPVFAASERMRVRAVIWCAALCFYAVALILSLR
jgi:hypothetical protein